MDDTLDARTRAACAAHRDTCSACAALDVRVRRSLLLCHNVRLQAPPCDLSARVLAAVRADRRHRTRRAVQRRALGGWAAVAAACAGVVIGVASWRGSAQGPASMAAAGAGSPAAITAPAVAVSRSGPMGSPRRLPVLGPIDEPPAVLGDTFPPAPPVGRPAMTRRVVEAGFLPVGFPAP